MYAWRDYFAERTVEFEQHLFVGTVVTNHVHLTLWQFVTVLLVHPSGDGLDHFGAFKGEYLVPSTSVGAIGGEVSTIVEAVERHAEVVAVRIDRIGQVVNVPTLGSGVKAGAINVETAHAHFSIGAVVEVTIGSEGRKPLVAACVDGLSEVLNGSEPSVAFDADAPKVGTTQSTGHV